MRNEMNLNNLNKKNKLEPKYMRMAIEVAKKEIMKKSNKTGGPFGACVVDFNGKVICCKSNRVIIENDPTQHAEVRAISSACKKLKTIKLDKHILYTTCEPCLMCRGATYWAQIPIIVYGSNQHDARKLGFDEINISDKQFCHMAKRNVKIIKGYMKDECKELFNLYKKKKMKIY